MAFPNADPYWGIVLLVIAGVLGVATIVTALLEYQGWLRQIWYMPIEDAARKAYERTRGSTLAEMTYQMDRDNPQEVLKSYASMIRDTKSPLYGERMPSRKMERVPKGPLSQLVVYG